MISDNDAPLQYQDEPKPQLRHIFVAPFIVLGALLYLSTKAVASILIEAFRRRNPIR